MCFAKRSTTAGDEAHMTSMSLPLLEENLGLTFFAEKAVQAHVSLVLEARHEMQHPSTRRDAGWDVALRRPEITVRPRTRPSNSTWLSPLAQHTVKEALKKKAQAAPEEAVVHRPDHGREPGAADGRLTAPLQSRL
jgi:hypothetical protein